MSPRSLTAITPALLLFGCLSSPAPKEDAKPVGIQPNAQVKIVSVEEHSLGNAIVSSARIAFDENRVAHVFSPVTGRVTQIIGQLGHAVKKGDTLAIITSPDMGNAMSDVNKAKPLVVQTERELSRQKELFAATAGTRRDLEAAQAAYDQASAELQRATEKLRLLMKQAQSNEVSQVFPLVAPIDGEIVARSINPGADIQGQYSGGTTQELYTIGRQDALWVLADVYEQDLGRVKLGAPVEVRTVAYPDAPFAGRVDWISGTLDPTTRTMTVRCTLTNDEQEHPLKAQMYATVTIQAEGKSGLAVPREAIVHYGEKTMVVAVEDSAPGTYARRPVIVDESGVGEFVPVLHGLERGDKIVSSGALLVAEVLK
jgi:cobalt-zinc-cadmium efflux system membrane fusion protein